MKRAINILVIILFLQLALVVGLRTAGDGTGEFAGNKQLLAFSPDQIDRLLIDNGEGQSLQLKKVADKWTLPASAGVAVDAGKVDSLLNSLAGIKRNWPVAKTEEAAKRFKVADNSFERRLVFKNGEKVLGTLLLGSSPGFKKVHARLKGEMQVFDIPFSVYQASLKTADWLDKQILQFKTDRIAAVECPDFTLQQNKGELSLLKAAANETLDNQKAKQLLEKLSNLNVMGLSSEALEPADSAKVKIVVRFTDGTSREYRFLQKEKQTLLTVSGFKPIYKVSNSIFTDLQQAKRVNMVKTTVAGSGKE